MAEKQYIIQAENEIELEESYCFFRFGNNGNKYKHRQNSGNMLSEGVPKRQRRNEDHIPEQSSAIHGIYDADVADCPTFKEVAKEIARDIEGCDLAGFNSNRFDIPVLAEEFLRAGVDIDMMKRKFIDVQVIYHKLEQRTLSAAYKFYCGKNLEDAHTAEADTRATYEVLKSQLDRYPEELQNDMAFLAEYSSFNKNVDFAGRIVYDDKGVEVFNFGKYKGMSVSEVLQKDPGYYSWILNGDFTLNTKNVLTKIRLRESGMMK